LSLFPIATSRWADIRPTGLKSQKF